MGYYQKRENKSGTVYRLFAKIYVPGQKEPLQPSKTFIPPAGISPTRAEKLAQIEADLFEEEKRKEILGNKYLMKNPDITFAEFSAIWLEKTQKEHSLSYYVHSTDLLDEINQAIGHHPLKKIDPNIIQDYFDFLDEKERIIYKVHPHSDFKEILKSNGFNYNRLRYDLKIQCNTLSRAYNGKDVSKEWADNIALKTELPIEKLFDVEIIRQPYAFETIDKYKRTIRAILSYAVKKRIVNENFATSKYVDWTSRPQQDNRQKGMTLQEVKELVSYLLEYPDMQAKISLLTLILTGFRKGEVAGLEWKDIDFDNQTISVKRSITEIKGCGAIEGQTKTGSSSRTISIADDFKTLLLEYKQWQEERKIALGDLWLESDKIFTKANGGAIFPSYFNAQLNKALEAAGLPHYSVHQLRHTHITLLISNGVSLPVVSLRAGHARTSTTSDVYAYALPSTDQAAANLLNNLLINSQKETAVRPEVSNEGVEDYHKAKEQMARLGFEDYDEYLDYLEFVEKKRSRGLTA